MPTVESLTHGHVLTGAQPIVWILSFGLRQTAGCHATERGRVCDPYVHESCKVELSANEEMQS